jgi:3,4-dihydroxy-9,10-secoandrosta-1,3,5(10)-triene-9,17-dione 4,5-dioxygenase
VGGSPVFGLGFVVVESADADAWQRFGEQVVGMMAGRDPDGRLLLRMDERVARFIIEPAGSDARPDTGSLGVLAGWECRSEQAWHQVASSLEGAGIDLVPTKPARPWCRESFSCVDPSGLGCEFFYGGRVDPATQFVSPIGVCFVTGQQAMGHITVATRDCAGAVEFYRGLLGFQVRETKTSSADGGMRSAFLSPNAREHSLALIAGGQSRVLHVLVEVTDLDSVGRAMDRCIDGLAPLSVSIGRHWNDQMVSCYVRTPSGFDVEYGYGGRVVDPETWSRLEQGGSDRVSLWGHRVMQPDGTFGKQIGQY